MINNFGQTPCQLLKEPHPKRLSPEEAILAKKKRKPPSLMATMPDWKPYLLDLGTLSTDKDPVVYINAPGWRRHFSQNSPDSTVITISSSGVVGIHQWIFQDNKTCYNLDVDPTFLTSGKFFFIQLGQNYSEIEFKFFHASNLSQNMFQIQHQIYWSEFLWPDIFAMVENLNCTFFIVKKFLDTFVLLTPWVFYLVSVSTKVKHCSKNFFTL